MPANKGKIAKNSMMLFIRMGIVLVVSLYTARVVLQQLGASDYGTYNVVGGIITMLQFMTATLAQGVQRFFNFHKGRGDSESYNKVFWAALVVMGIVAIALVVIGETLGLWFLNTQLNIPADRMYAANWVYQFSVISTVINFLIVPYNATIVAHEDFGIYAYVTIGIEVLNLGVAFLLQATSGDKLIFYAAMMCLLQVVNAMTLFVITKCRYKEVHIVKHKDKEVYKSLLTFSGWNILGVGSYTLGNTGVNMILNIFFGTVVNAARGIAFQISSKVDQFINNIQQAMNPQIVQLYAKGEYKEVQSLVDDNFRWNFALYWLIALPLFFEIDYILKIWLGEVPEYTSLFTIIIVIRCLLKCFERPINSLNFAIGNMKAINIFAASCVLATTILMCVLFAIGLPPYWAFVLDCISIATCICFYMTRSRNAGLFSFRHFIKSIALPIATVIVISFVGTWLLRLIHIEGFWRLLYTLGVTTVLSCVLMFFVMFTKENRAKILGVVKRITTLKNK